MSLQRNNTSFPLKVANKLQKLLKRYEEDEKTGLMYYQYLVKSVMTMEEFGIGDVGNSRGLLIYHTMGVGKTFLAISTAMAMWETIAPIIIVSKSLQKNFKRSIEEYIEMVQNDPDFEKITPQKAISKFRFVSLDAYNMAEQVAKQTTGTKELTNLNDKLLIIDEAHNFFRAIINSSNQKTNARQLYNMIIQANNLKILFLTGTVPTKDPFELVPCFNMLAGFNLLPVQYEIFYRDFVSGELIKNRAKLANKLVGMVSYASYDLPRIIEDKGSGSSSPIRGVPEEKELIIERVEMSKDQYKHYLLARDVEEGEAGSRGMAAAKFSSNRRVADLAIPSTGSVGTYYVKSRTISNYLVPPEYRDLPISKMPADAFTEENSPKMYKLVKNIMFLRDENLCPMPALVYSQFVGLGGLSVVARYLQNEGFTEYVIEDDSQKEGGHDRGDIKRKICDCYRYIKHINKYRKKLSKGVNRKVQYDIIKSLDSYLISKDVDKFSDRLAEMKIPTRLLPLESKPSCIREDVEVYKDHIAINGKKVVKWDFTLRMQEMIEMTLDIMTKEEAEEYLVYTLLRYASLSSSSFKTSPGREDFIDLSTSGQQWGIPQKVYNILYDDEDVRIEGFASPFNSRLFGKPGTAYCSISDDDKVYGSLGDFFEVDIATAPRGYWCLNPPFIEKLIDEMADTVDAWLRYYTRDMKMFVFVPDWRDSPGIEKMLKSEFLIDMIEFKSGEYYIESLKHLFKAKFSTLFLVLSNKDESFESREEIIDAFKTEEVIYSDGGYIQPVGGSNGESSSTPQQRFRRRNYAIISGGVPQHDREQMRKAFNAGEIGVLLISKTGAEGLDLKGTRQVHILEPYWDWSRVKQVIARGVRLGSHDHLPEDERNVQPFIYISSENREMYALAVEAATAERASKEDEHKLVEEITIDEKFYRRATERYRLMQEFSKLLREVSLECPLYNVENCRICVPTDEKLFHEDQTKDLRLSDPCSLMSERQIEVKEVTFEGKKYYYRENESSPMGVDIYDYNEEFDSHVLIDYYSNLFADIYEAIQ